MILLSHPGKMVETNRQSRMSAHIFIRTFLALSALVFLSSTQSLGDEPGNAPPEYLYWIEHLHELQLDPHNVATVKNLTLQRDTASFQLHEGTLYLSKPIRERIVAAVFVGSGTFSFAPPTRVEQNQLRRFFEKDSLKEEFSFLFMMFGDSTEQELQTKAQFAEGDVPRNVRENVDFAVKFPGRTTSSDFDSEFVRTFLEGWTNSLFYAHFSSERSNPLFFEIDPFAEEEVRLMRRVSEVFFYSRETISQFHTEEEYATGVDYANHNNDLIEVAHQTIHVTLNEDLDFSARSTTQLRAREDRIQYLNFFLHPKIRIDSVRQNRNLLKFWKEDDAWQVWAQCDPPLEPGDLCSLQVYYHGDVIEGPIIGRVFVDGEYTWYPRFWGRSKPTYDLFFVYPGKFQLVGTGREVSSEQREDSAISHWKVDTGIHNATFVLGKYKKHLVEVSGLPSITYYENEDVFFAGRQWDLNDVALDVGHALDFFTTIFGPCPVDRLYAVERFQRHSESFLGILHISEWARLQSQSKFEFHRPHELAHQWWGLGVDIETYHDQWIGEAFATYSSLMYAQSVLGSSDRFFGALEKWGELIIGNREFLFGGGKEEGPVSLGPRTEGTETSGDMFLIIYFKGAYVLHMLRIMLLDLNSMSEERFIAMMQDFYTTYRGKRASTRDFQAIAEKYTGTSMDWFFDQWIYGTEIPLYKFAYRTTHSNDGTYKVRCRVRQEEVSEDFTMPVPIRVRLEDEREFLFRVPVTGKVVEFDLPEFDAEPAKVIFNDLKGVLCEIEYEDWDE